MDIECALNDRKNWNEIKRCCIVYAESITTGNTGNNEQAS